MERKDQARNALMRHKVPRTARDMLGFRSCEMGAIAVKGG